MYVCMYVCVYWMTDCLMDGWMDGCLAGWLGGWLAGRLAGWMDGWMDWFIGWLTESGLTGDLIWDWMAFAVAGTGLLTAEMCRDSAYPRRLDDPVWWAGPGNRCATWPVTRTFIATAASTDIATCTLTNATRHSLCLHSSDFSHAAALASLSSLRE